MRDYMLLNSEASAAVARHALGQIEQGAAMLLKADYTPNSRDCMALNSAMINIKTIRERHVSQ